MTTAFDVISRALTRLSTDRHRTANQYLNIAARPGNENTPRRLMSDIGFLQATSFSYAVPNASNYSYDDVDNPRTIKQIVLVGYGVRADYNRLISQRPEDRNVSTLSSTVVNGLVPYPDNTQVLMSGELDAATYAASKTAQVMQGVTTSQGPAPHFIVDRRGNIIIGPGLDAVTSVIPTYMDNGVFIAVETALVIGREDHSNRRFDRITELPFTGTQLVTLGILINKLIVAVGSSFTRTFVDTLSATATGFTYVWADTITNQANQQNDILARTIRRTLGQGLDITPYNFRETPRTSPIPNVTFDYSPCSSTVFFQIVDAQGSFDLAADIWRPIAAPAATTGREEIAASMGQIDTAGAESVALGAYVTLAMGERSNEMQTTQRQQMFVQRQRISHADADVAASQASDNAATGDSSEGPTEEIPPGPHTYDFTTGLWGDNSAW